MEPLLQYPSDAPPSSCTVNAAFSSMVGTSMCSEESGKLADMAGQAQPLGRNAQPGGVAPLARLLLSDDAANMNCLNIPVTGGSQF